jgi:hypothetical protein
MSKSAGKDTGNITAAGRKVYKKDGEYQSERSTTLKMGKDKWVNVPSIHGNRQYTEDKLVEKLKAGEIKPTSTHKSKDAAIAAAMKRSKMLAEEPPFNKGGLAPSQKSLKSWTKEEWGTKSGKPSTQGSKATGERYLPKAARQALTSAEYAATTKAKREGKKKGQQFVAQPKAIAKKTSKYRA